MHERGQALGRGRFFLTRFGRFLDEIVPDQGVLFGEIDDDGGCDTGHCFT